MPVVVMQPHSGHSTISSGRNGPNSHLCLSMMVCMCINPPFGLVAFVMSLCSKSVANNDYETARIRGRISMFISITGIVISGIAALIFVLIFYTRDS